MWVSSVSNSRLDSYRQCGWKYLLKYVYYIPEPDNGKGYAQFGSFIHKIFELGYEKKTLKELQEIAASVRSKYIFEDKDFNLNLINTCLNNFLRFNAQLYKTIHTELDMKVEIEPGIFLHVIIDRVVKGLDGSILIIDYKSGFREKTKLELLKDPQMRGYVLAYSKQFNVPIEKITAMHYYPRTNNVVPVVYMNWDVTNQIKYVKNTTWNIRKAKITDFKPTKNSFCNFCGYKDTMCPLFVSPAEVSRRIEEEKALSAERKLHIKEEVDL